MAGLNLPLAFAELLVGAVVMDAALKGDSIANVIKGQAKQSPVTGLGGTTAGGQSGQGSGGGSGVAPSNASPNASLMLAAATAASAAHIPYSTSVQSTGLLAGFRSDCSGFVSWVLSKGGINTGDATTVTLPSFLQSGPGSQVTVWNRPLPGQQGHVIINILGHWFESGGGAGGGIINMTAGQVASELGVSNLAALGGGQTPNGFQPLHPNGL